MMRIVLRSVWLTAALAIPTIALGQSAPPPLPPQAVEGNRLTKSQYEAGAVILFDGRGPDTLWDVPGRNWVIDGGTLMRSARGGDAWFHRFRVPGRVEFSFDYRADAGATGGLAYLADAQVLAIGTAAEGMPAGCTAAPADGDWHSVRIRAADGGVEQWIDGKQACKAAAPRATGDDRAMFFPRLLDGRGTIRFRNLIALPVPVPGAFAISTLAGLSGKIAIADGLRRYSARVVAERPKAIAKGLGYPVPFIAPAGKLVLEPLGEDADATFYRYATPALDGLEATGMVAVPKGAKRPMPVLVAVHGTAGSPEMGLQPTTVYHNMIRGPLHDGWLVIAPQMVTFNRREAPFGNTIDPAAVGRWTDDLEARGVPILAVESARVQAALGPIMAKWPTDPARVAVTGLSYGGYLTVYLSAVEPRIKAGAAVAGFSPYTVRAVAPSSMDQLRAIAPKPIALIHGVFDQFHDLNAGWADGSLEDVEKAYGKNGRFAFVADFAGHDYSWDVAKAFLDKALPVRTAP